MDSMVMDKAINRVAFLKAGVPMKVIEELWLWEHDIKVVHWNILKTDS